MLPLTAQGLIRFDVEDFLTPQSDDALAYMLASMRRTGMPGSYGLVGKKVDAMRARGQAQLLAELAREPALGFHSVSHSEHPTLAEELDRLPYEQALSVFVDRERPGVQTVCEYVRAPSYFTQPGGNWIPEAAEGLPALGMDIYFTDSFNSYVVDLPGPYWYGDVLLYSFPVINPRPFGLGLPGNLDEAIALIEAQQSKSGPFMVMLHPTELVTYEFWDAVNFSRGTTPPKLVPAPVRPYGEQRAALESFEKYLQEIRHFNIEWYDSETMKATVKPRRPVTVSRLELVSAVRRDGWVPLPVAKGYLSAAETLYGLAKLSLLPADAQVPISMVRAPVEWQACDSRDWSPLDGEGLRTAAGRIVESVERSGRLPTDRELGGVILEQVMQSLMQSSDPVRPTFLDYIKQPSELHWDWPIFPHDFHPWRLVHDARRLAWTLKPAGSVSV